MSEKCWFVDPTAEGGLTWGDPEGDPDDGWDVGEAFTWLEVTPEVRASRDALVAAIAERGRFREHSVILNSVSWRMAELLGLVPDGADEVYGDALDEVEQIGTELETLRGIAARVRDGWTLIPVAGRSPEWENWDGVIEQPTEAEVHAIYGQKRRATMGDRGKPKRIIEAPVPEPVPAPRREPVEPAKTPEKEPARP